MKKINAWIKKFFGIGAGDDVHQFKVICGCIEDDYYGVACKEYKRVVFEGALKEGSTVIVDHNKKTVTFKMI